jgi:hypothetical protein
MGPGLNAVKSGYSLGSGLDLTDMVRIMHLTEGRLQGFTTFSLIVKVASSADAVTVNPQAKTICQLFASEI